MFVHIRVTVNEKKAEAFFLFVFCDFLHLFSPIATLYLR
jgi:hypothetical protein